MEQIRARRRKITALFLAAAMVLSACPQVFADTLENAGFQDNVEVMADAPEVGDTGETVTTGTQTTRIQLGVSIDWLLPYGEGVKSKEDIKYIPLSVFHGPYLQEICSDKELIEKIYKEVRIISGTQDITDTVSSSDLDYRFELVSEVQFEYEVPSSIPGQLPITVRDKYYCSYKTLSTSDNTLVVGDDTHNILKQTMSVNEIYASVSLRTGGTTVYGEDLLEFGFIPESDLNTLYKDMNTTVSENLGDLILFFPKAIGYDNKKKLNNSFKRFAKLYVKEDYEIHGDKAANLINKITLGNVKKPTVNMDGSKSLFVKKDSKQAFIKKIKLEKMYKQYQKGLNKALKEKTKKLKTLPFVDTNTDRTKGDGAEITFLIYPALMNGAALQYYDKQGANSDHRYTSVFLKTSEKSTKDSTAKFSYANIGGNETAGKRFKGQKLTYDKNGNPSTKKDIYADTISYPFTRVVGVKKPKVITTTYPIFRGVNRCCGWTTGNDEANRMKMLEDVVSTLK